MEQNKMRVRITLTDNLLGSNPSDTEIYSSYVAANAPDAPTKQEEIERMGTQEFESKGTTVFIRDDDGNPILYNYVIKGFLKNACGALRENKSTLSSGLKAYKKKIDNLIFVQERMIPIKFEGEVRICQRPLRAQTAQGDRVALASSEEIPAPATLEFTFIVLEKSMLDILREWLDYGQFNGLGQWHNSGKGTFTWEELPIEE
jgi:hypothetical protein